jgi:hypothetical protein
VSECDEDDSGELSEGEWGIPSDSIGARDGDTDSVGRGDVANVYGDSEKSRLDMLYAVMSPINISTQVPSIIDTRRSSAHEKQTCCG